MRGCVASRTSCRMSCLTRGARSRSRRRSLPPRVGRRGGRVTRLERRVSDVQVIARRIEGLSAAKREILMRRLAPAQPDVEAAEPVIVPDPEHRFEPFPLTDIQQAYWVG